MKTSFRGVQDQGRVGANLSALIGGDHDVRAPIHRVCVSTDETASSEIVDKNRRSDGTELYEGERITDADSKMTYGLGKIRSVSVSVSAVAVGSRIRMNAVVPGVTGGCQLTVDQTIEIDGGTKAAVVSRGLYGFHH